MLRHSASARAAWRFGALLVGVLGCRTTHETICIGGPKCPDAGIAPLDEDASAHVAAKGHACAMQSVSAKRGPGKSVDVIFIIDNSGSMQDEIAAVRANINQNFAAIVQSSAVDMRVILLSHYGTTGTYVCIGPPLAGADCSAGLAATNSAVFFHYDVDIQSTDAFCRILETFDHADAEGRAPHGWQDWARPDAQKAFVIITDDSAKCVYGMGENQVEFGAAGADPYSDALRFHEALLAKSPAQFGVPPNIKYQFFSIVGLAPNDPPETPLFPYDDLRNMMCDTAASPGLSYQALSIVTDALRYPVCEGRTFDSVFQVLARSVIQASQADCVFELPEPPANETLDPSTVNIEYHAQDGSAQRFSQVATKAACSDDHSFYITDKVELCPDACAVVQGDPEPEVEILYACKAHVD
jgi:hypothetical protein